jgi:hypothetical protein
MDVVCISELMIGLLFYLCQNLFVRWLHGQLAINDPLNLTCRSARPLILVHSPIQFLYT